MTQLTKNFTLEEFVRSDTAVRMRIDNQPPTEHVLAIKALCENVLEHVREAFGPVKISSGYRSEALNKAIKGSPKSQHTRGQAADIIFDSSEKNAEVASWIENNLIFDQLIFEDYKRSSDLKESCKWIHVSFRADGRNRQQVLLGEVVNGKTVFRSFGGT